MEGLALLVTDYFPIFVCVCVWGGGVGVGGLAATTPRVLLMGRERIGGHLLSGLR